MASRLAGSIPSLRRLVSVSTVFTRTCIYFVVTIKMIMMMLMIIMSIASVNNNTKN